MTDVSITAANVARGEGAKVDTGTAGATVNAGQSVYLDSADQLLKLTDSNSATAAAHVPKGIALHGASLGQPLAYQYSGEITIGGTLTQGHVYVTSTTPGGIAPHGDIGSGQYTAVLGVAKSASVLAIGIVAPNAVV